MTSSSSSSLTSLRELEAVNSTCLHAVQQRLATLRASLGHVEAQRASLNYHTNNTPSTSSSTAYMEEFYKPRIVETATATRKKRGGKRERIGDEMELSNNNSRGHVTASSSSSSSSKAAVVTGDLDLSGLFGDDDDADRVLTAAKKKESSTAHSSKATNNISKSTSSLSTSEGASVCSSSGVDASCILQLDVIEGMKRGGVAGSPSPLAALCFAAVEQGFSAPPPTSTSHPTHQPVSGVALLQIDNIPRMRAVELFPHILSALEDIGGGGRCRQDTTTNSASGVAVVGGIIQPGCWHDTVVVTTTNNNSNTRVSIPVGDLDPFSSHILLAHLRTERSKRVVGKPLSLTSPISRSPTSSSELHGGGNVTAPPSQSSPSLMTVATEAELASIVSTEHLFPSPYKGARGHGVTPSVLPRTRGSSGMKALSSNWSEDEDELLMQLVLEQMRKERAAGDVGGALIINPTPTTTPSSPQAPIDWPLIGTEMGASFGTASVGANAMASWLRWENVLRPVVSSAALGTELSFEDNTYPLNNHSMMKSQSQNEKKCGNNIKGGGVDNSGSSMVVVEGSQRLRGLGELFKGTSTKKYQGADAWPTADDEFLWALVRQANFKLDRAFWMRMKYVAPLRDSYAPFAVLQRFQQFTNPLHCPTLSGSTKALTVIANTIVESTRRPQRYRTTTPAGMVESDDDEDRNIVSLSPLPSASSTKRGGIRGSSGSAARYHVLAVQRTHEVLLQASASSTTSTTAEDDLVATTTNINDKYPTTYGDIFRLKNQFGVVDITPAGGGRSVPTTTTPPPNTTNADNTRALLHLHPLIRKRSLPTSPFGDVCPSPRRTTPGGTMVASESMVFEDTFTPISSTSPTTPSFPAAASSMPAGTATRRRHRATHLNGWSTHELQALSMLVKSFVLTKNLCIGGYHHSAVEREDDDGEDPWFGVDLSLIHNDFTTMCVRSSNNDNSDEAVMEGGGGVTAATTRVSGPLGGQSLECSLQFHTKEQLRGVLRSLNSTANKE